ncbi:MAG: hypothetical protein ABGY42_16540 [bacterium]
MKIGINPMLWTDDPTAEALWPVFERIRRIGFGGVELPIFSHHHETWAELACHLDDRAQIALFTRNLRDEEYFTTLLPLTSVFGSGKLLRTAAHLRRRDQLSLLTAAREWE